MPTIPELRQRRETATDWITYASWTAIVTAVLGGLITLTAVLQDRQNLAEAGVLLPGLVGQVVFGLKLRERSFWAATALMVSYLYSAVVHSLTVSLLSGILVKAIIAFIYIRGFVAVDSYIESDKAIAAASSGASLETAPGERGQTTA